MICYHHNDTDGLAAAALVRFVHKKCKMFEIDYLSTIDFSLVAKNEEIIIVDFSFKPDDMKKLLEITKDVTWIDHHQTAIEDLAEFEGQLRGLRREGECGALLTWKYYKMGAVIPRALTLINDWDIFTRDYDPETTNFHYGLEIYDRSPSSGVWYQIFYSVDKIQYISTILRKGETIKRYLQNHYEKLLETYGYEAEFEGHLCIILNTKGSSLVFDSVRDEYQVKICYLHDGARFKVSLYNDDEKVDVSRICHKYGGGGHPGAAGFTTTYLPWLEGRE